MNGVNRKLKFDVKKLVLLFGTLMLSSLPAFAQEDTCEVNLSHLDKSSGMSMSGLLSLAMSMQILSPGDLGPELTEKMKTEYAPAVITLVGYSKALADRADAIRATQDAEDTAGSLKKLSPKIDLTPPKSGNILYLSK